MIPPPAISTTEMPDFFERLDVLALVRSPALDQSLQDGIPDFGFGDGAAGDGGVESGEMMTVEMTD